MRGGASVTAPRAAPVAGPTMANARAGLLADASNIDIAAGLRSFGATLSQCAPPSRVRWTRPLLVAAQNVFASLREKANELIAGPPPRPPRLLFVSSPVSPALRSGLTVSQCIPLSC